MHDAGAGRHDLEVVERRLAPTQELVALAVAPVLELDVALQGVRACRTRRRSPSGRSPGRRGQRVHLAAGRRRARPRPRAWWPGRPRTGTPVKSCITTRAGVNGISMFRIGRGIPVGDRLDVFLGDVGAIFGARRRFSASTLRLQGGARFRGPRRGGRSHNCCPRRAACRGIQTNTD